MSVEVQRRISQLTVMFRFSGTPATLLEPSKTEEEVGAPADGQPTADFDRPLTDGNRMSMVIQRMDYEISVALRVPIAWTSPMSLWTVLVTGDLSLVCLKGIANGAEKDDVELCIAGWSGRGLIGCSTSLDGFASSLRMRLDCVC